MADIDGKREARPFKVLIVDDHPIVREGLSALIDKQSDLVVCGQAEDNDEALRLVEATQPDVAIVDISLKTGSGIDLIRQIKSRHKTIRILVSSMYDEALYAERSLRAGAMGYINKQEAGRNMISAIRQVIDNKTYVSENVAEKIIHRVVGARSDVESDRVEGLSNRELEVFRLIGNGLTTMEIAERMVVSPKTIQTYRQRIKDKLSLKNAAELSRHASKWVLENT